MHTGLCEILGEDLGGIAVHIAARVVAAADPGEVLVSSTVKDLVAGSGITLPTRSPRAQRCAGRVAAVRGGRRLIHALASPFGCCPYPYQPSTSMTTSVLPCWL